MPQVYVKYKYKHIILFIIVDHCIQKGAHGFIGKRESKTTGEK